MPEGDTIWQLADRITARFVGEACHETITRHPKLLGVDFTGTHLVAAESIGKFLCLRFDDGRTLVSHLRMDGSWTMGRRSTAPEMSRYIELRMESGWLTAQTMPQIEVVATVDEADVVGHLGPDLCAAAADGLPGQLREIAAAMRGLADTALAAAMLDQRLVAGFGNVYAVELPFIVGVSPFHPTSDIDGLEPFLRIGAALIRVNASRHIRNTTGRRLHTADHWIYGAPRGRCPWCSAALKSERDTPWGRLTVWCPACQSGQPGAVVDVGRVQEALALHPARRDRLLATLR